MGKVICDICGTSFQDTATHCPLCGCSRDFRIIDVESENNYELTQAISSENEITEHTADPDSGMPLPQFESRAFRGISETPEEPDPFRDEPGHNMFLVVVFVILIALSLIASALLYLLILRPNARQIVAETETTELTAPEYLELNTEPDDRIPCEAIYLTGGIGELTREGQMWLIHISVLPEDTTDTLVFQSEDESVVTVNGKGRITAIGEGSTNVIVSCGDRNLVCPVTVKFMPDTTEVADSDLPTIDAISREEDETGEDSTNPGDVQQEQDEASQPQTVFVVLKLEKTDIILNVGYGFTLKLACDLKPEDIQWTSSNTKIVTVDQKGYVKAVGYGVAVVTAKYGDQTVECVVRCQ